MHNYLDLYRKGVKHLDTDLNDLIKVLNKGESICLCSLPNMGNIRLIDYLAYTLRNDKKYIMIYDSDGSLDKNTLETKVKRYTSKKFLVLLPNFLEKSLSFKKLFQKLSDNKKNNFLSVIDLGYEIIKEKQGFLYSVRPLAYLKIRKPLNYSLTKSVMSSRRFINGWDIPQEFELRIYQLSGGIIGLVKYICSYLDKFHNINKIDLVQYPPIRDQLDSLNLAFDILNTSNLKKLGLIDRKGNIRGVLLQYYMNFKSNTYFLSSSLKKVLNLFLNKKNQIVTLDDVYKNLHNGEDFSLWSHYKIISRLREAIKDKFEIENVKGKGYILKDKYNA